MHLHHLSSLMFQSRALSKCVREMRHSPLAGLVGRAATLMILGTGLVALFVCIESWNTGEAQRINTVSDEVVRDLDQMRFDNLVTHEGFSRNPNRLNAQYTQELRRCLAERRVIAERAMALVRRDGPQLIPAMAAFTAAIDDYDRTLAKVQIAARTPADAERKRERLFVAFRVVQDKTLAWAHEWDVRGSASVAWAARLAVISVLLTLLFGCGFAIFTAIFIVRPIGMMTTAMQALAGGHDDVSIPAHGRSDEIGMMAAAVRVFKQAAIDKQRLEAEAEASALQIAAERTKRERERQRLIDAQTEVVHRLEHGLSRLATGDLSHRLDRPFTAQYEPLRTDFNEALHALGAALGQVDERTRLVHRSVAGIGAAASELSSGATEQADQLHSAVDALSDIAAAIEQIAGRMTVITDISHAAKDNAERSAATARDAAVAMAEADAASSTITKILVLIDQIARQTNFLALNAAIEASRAGAEGSGFAAVASEVRALAVQVAKAGREIKDLTNTAQHRVGDAAAFVAQAKSAMEKNAVQVFAIHEATAAITDSTHQQSRRLADIYENITAVNHVTERNAGIARGSNDLVALLSRETANMLVSMGQFKFGRKRGAGAQADGRWQTDAATG